MPHPTEARQLPGVNGQWIKTSRCPPTIADLDADEELVVRMADGSCRITSLNAASGYELWSPIAAVDPRPLFTLGPATSQPATTERRIVQLACHPKGTAIYAVADDGTAWVSSETIPDWVQVGTLPLREAPHG